MLTKPYYKSLAYMHLATFLFGFTAILGKVISLEEIPLVWWRMLLAALVFFLFPTFLKQLRQFGVKHIFLFMIIGCIVALHWVTFYGSIKLADSASIPLVCFGTVATFTAFLEPLILKKRFDHREIGLGALVFVGLLIVVKANPENTLSLESSYVRSILVGILSALLAAVFSILNKKYIGEKSTIVATWAQMAGGFLFLSCLIPILGTVGYSFSFKPSNSDWMYLLILSIICTNIAFSLELKALKKVSAFTANLVLNLEPVYGIIGAAILLQEHQQLKPMFYVGALLVILAVFIGPIAKRQLKRSQA